MEEFLQRAQSKLNRSKRLEKVHVVLGNKSCDLDSLISTLAYAYFLDKVTPPDVLCLPVLNIPRRDFNYFTETRFILEELNIPESFHIFRDEINLHQLNAEGKLSLTLVNSNMLTSEDKSLESAVVKVINPDEQCDGSLELQASSSSLVVKEILQEAPELITQQLAYLLRGSILFKCMSLEADRITEQQEKILSILEEKFPDLPPREEIISVLQETQFNPQGVSIEEVMLKDLKEISDGEIKVAISTVYMTLEDCMLHRSLVGDLKAFIDKYGFDVLVILANSLSDEKQAKRQIAVYSENLELGNQICCELEECQSPCLELDPLECGCDQILIYHQENSLVTCDQIFLLVKEVINRRQPEMVSNSRTSSTEAVAGSAPLSQGSSGIMELYGSDIEPQPSSANFIENPQDLNGSMQAHVDVNVDLVSPDSGLATIRSSRSSKESSVFLSDDSPVAEGAASHHSLLPGFDSYSPIPEGPIAEEQKPQSRDNSDNFDLFSFDLAPVVTAPSESSSRSVDCSPADDYFLNSDSSEGQQHTVQKELDEANLLENDTANYSTDLLMTKNEDDNLAEFDENPGEMCEKTSSLIDLVEGDSSSPEMLKSADSRIPPTPMNSLVETSPLDNGQPLFFPQDVIQKINEIDGTNYSQSRVRYGSWWDGFDLESRNADTWSSSEQESVFQSPILWKDCKESPLLREHIDRRASDSVFLQKQPKQMEYMRAGLWDKQFKQDNWNHENQEKNSEHSYLQTDSLEETKQELETFTDPWKVSQLTPMMSDAWCSGEGKGSQLAGDSYEVWTKFDAGDIARSSENVWNMPTLDREKKSLNIPEEWAISKTSLSDSSEITADNEAENPPIRVSPEAWDKERYYSVEDYGKSENTDSVFNNMQDNSKLQTEEETVFGDPKHRPKQFENIETWNIYDKNISKEVTEVVVPWEDTFVYKHSDLSSSNIGEDLVVSPLDTNYSTSDSYISPTYVEDERETEDKDFDDETVIDKLINPNFTEPKVLEKANKEPLSPKNMPFSSVGNTDIWNAPLNNVTQLQERNSQITALSASAKPFLNTEQTANQCFPSEIHTNENIFSVSENRRITLVYNQTVNDLSPPQNKLNTKQTAAENVEMVSSVPVEGTDIATPTSDTGNGLDLKICDLGSEIFSKKAAQNTADVDEKLDSQDSAQQLNSWSLQSEQGCEEGWNNAIVISREGKEEYERTDESSGQQMITDICNKPVQEDSEYSCNIDLEDNRSTTEVPRSPEKMRNSISLEALVTENESFSNQSNPVSQEKRKGLSQNNVESSSSASEEGRNYESFDDSRPQNYSYSETSQLLSEKAEKEATVIEDVTSPEMESSSESSDKGSDNPENNSSKMPGSSGIWNDSGKSGCHLVTSIPLMNEPQEALGEVKEGLPEVVSNHPGICNSELVSFENKSELNRTDEKSFIDEFKKSPSSGYVSVPDITDMSVVENSFSREIGSGRNETPVNLQPANNLCGDPCLMISDNFPQTAWNSQPCEDVQSPATSPEASEVFEMANTTSSLSKDIQIKSYLEEDNVWSDSINDCAQSSGTSPDLSDASVNVWGDLPVASHHRRSKDLWDIKNNKNLEDACKRNECEEGFETSTEQNKVPKSLDFWNAHVDDDTVSSLSSPDINEDSENSEACPELINKDAMYENKQHKTSEIGEDYAQSNTTSPEANEDNLCAKTKVGEEVQIGIFNENPEAIKAGKVLQEDLTIMECNETSEYLGHWETLQKKAQVSVFSEKTGSGEDSCFYQMNENTTLTSAVDDKEEYSSKAVDLWSMSLEADLRTDSKATAATFDFPEDSSEWWNSQPCEEKQLEDQYSVSGHSATNQSTNSKEDSWRLPSQDEELTEACFTNASNDGNQPAPLYCDEKENERLVHPMNIPDGQISQENVQFKQFDAFMLDKEERGLEEQLFPTDEKNQLTPQNPFSDEEQRMSDISVQEITVLDLPEDSEGNSSLIPQEQQQDTCGRLEVSSSLPGAFTVEDLSFEMTEKSSPGWNVLVPQTALIPDILQDNTQESNQLFSVEPDLWTNAEQIVTLKSDGENPDILSHCDQDNSSEVSSSPDVCQEYEAKHASIPSSQIGMEAEDKDSQLIHAWSNMSKEADFDSECQLVEGRGGDKQKVETQSESGSPQDYEQGKTAESYQLFSSNTQEPPEFAILEEYGLENKLVSDPVESAEITNDVLEVVSLDLRDTFHNSFTPASHQGIPTDAAQIATSQVHSVPMDVPLPDRAEPSLKEISALAEAGKYSDIDHVTGDEPDMSEECVDESETGVEHNIRNTSVTNAWAGICSGSNILAVVGSEAAEGESKDKQILSPKSFLPAGNEGHESDSDDQLAGDIAEPEDVIENDVPVFKEITGGQSAVVSTPASYVSFGAAPSDSTECAKDELSLQQPFCESLPLDKPFPLPTPSEGAEGTLMTKDRGISDHVSGTSTECLQETPRSVPSLSEPEAAPGASGISTVKSEAATTGLDSPPGGDTRSADEAGADSLLFRASELRKSSESPEVKSAEGKEDVRMQVRGDPASLEMDYILVTEGENIPSRKDTLERKESDFAFEEVNVADQTESHEGFSPDHSWDTFHPVSITNEREDHYVCGTEWDSVCLGEKSPSVVHQKPDEERRSQESCGQDEGWIVLGQNEVSDISPEDISAKSEMPKLESGHSGEELAAVVAQELILHTQAEFQVETPLQKSLEHEDCSSSGSLTTEDESSGVGGAHVLQVVGADGAWEANSQQGLRNNVGTEQEMKEETVLLNNERELSQKSGLVQEDVGMDIPFSEGVLSPSSTEMRPEPPNSLDLNGSHPRRIKLTAPNINLSLDRSEGSVLSDDNLDTPDEIDINVDDLDTPDEADSFEYAGQEEQAATKDASQEESESIPEYTAEEEREDNRLWRTVVIGEQEQRIDMKVIEPYKKVISHGGYYGDGLNAIIVFAACFLPDSSRTDYNYVMENLFLYVISTLELMVAEDYMIVYLNGATPRRRMPGLGWMKKCYQMIDRRLRKNLKSFIIVHPSWFIRTILAVTRPFISSKFSSKIQYVNTLAELREMIPMEYVHIPDSIVNIDMSLK